MPQPWKDRLSAIGQSLLTVEVNTVVTTGLSAQKMPEVPLALHSLVQAYGDYLATAGFQVTTGLLAKAATRVGGIDQSATREGGELVLRELRSWPFPTRVWTEAERLAGLNQTSAAIAGSAEPAADLTNGAETFEAFQWAAWAALQTLRAGGALRGDPNPSVLSRINANSRQLKEAALRLEHQQGQQSSLAQMLGRETPASVMARNKLRLSRLLAPRSHAETVIENTEATPPRLFGGTVEETARALFDHPRPVFTVDPDVTILIRKAWDVGVQRVCLQTVMQVDGDMLQVIGDMGKDDRDFLTQMHKASVKDAVGQWHSLFDVVRQLAGDVGRVVFGA